MSLIPSESRVHGLHFCRRWQGSVFNIFVMSCEGCIICAVACGTAVQGHPRSILVPIERACSIDFLLVINSNLGPISHRFWDTATYLSKTCTDPGSRVLRGQWRFSWSLASATLMGQQGVTDRQTQRLVDTFAITKAV